MDLEDADAEAGAGAGAEFVAPALLALPDVLLGETPADGRVGRISGRRGVGMMAWRAQVAPLERVALLAVREEGEDDPDTAEGALLALADEEAAGVSCSVVTSLSAGTAAAAAGYLPAPAAGVRRRVRLRRGLLLRRAGEAAAAAAAAGGELAPAADVPSDCAEAPAAAALVERRALADALRLAGSTMVTEHEMCLLENEK